MKKSKSIKRSLVISSTALVTLTMSCTDKNSVRNRYNTLADCKIDYNDDQCENIQGAYYGPYYHYSSTGSTYAGRSSLNRGVSSSASHIINYSGAAVTTAGALAAMKLGSFKSFATGGFGSTAHFHGVSS